MTTLITSEMKNDPRTCERNLCNFAKKPEKIQVFNGIFFKLVNCLRLFVFVQK